MIGAASASPTGALHLYGRPQIGERLSRYYGVMASKFGVLWVLVLLGCERKPTFVSAVPADEKGGFLVMCYSVTDFARRAEQCYDEYRYQGIPVFHNYDGGCHCAQHGPLTLPPLETESVASAAMSFDDYACSGSYIAACMPRVIPTDQEWNELGLPSGQLRLYKALEAFPDQALRIEPYSPNQNWMNVGQFGEYTANIGRVNDSRVRDKAIEDIRGVMFEGCRLAHWAALQYYITGVAAGSVNWPSALSEVSTKYYQYTTTLDGYDLYIPAHEGEFADRNTSWGDAANRLGPGGVPVVLRNYVTHAITPLTACHPNLTYPALGVGYDTVLGFGVGAGPPKVSHAPPGSPRTVPTQRVVLDSGSTTTLTVDTLEPIALGWRGSLEVTLSNCDAARRHCNATLNAVEIESAPFELAGYHVQMLRILATSVGDGGLSGNTLALTSFSATVEAKLTDGRYDFVPITSGVALANWDPAHNRFTIAINLSGTAEGSPFSLSGTMFGSFANTSPFSVAQVVSPTPIESSDSGASIECQSPQGTDVTLSAAASVDREDGVPKVTWYDSSRAILGTANEVTLAKLPVGATEALLTTYDTGGLTDNEDLSVNIVDTLPPQIEANDVCVSPPNRRNVNLRLGQELIVRALDQCEGELQTVEIVDVQSTVGAGVLSWSKDSVCVSAERQGSEREGRIYNVTLRATDATGNESTKIVAVTIVHNGPTSGCLKTQELPACP